MIHACQLLGAKIHIFPERLDIEGVDGKVQALDDVIHAGNSGIILRFLSAIGALSKSPVVITGDYSIRHQRPMKTLGSALSQLGVSVTSLRGDGYAPLIIQGPLKPGRAAISGEDSQPVSALLIASCFADGPIEIDVTNPGEKPWVALTLSWFDRLGIPYDREGFEKYRLFGKTSYEGFQYTVPGDMSSLAFPLAAALVTQSEITIHNVDIHDPQGDKELISIFQKMGAIINIDEKEKKLFVKKGGRLSGISVDINNFIDSITVLAAVACHAEGDMLISNAAIARQKECNRLQAITAELKKMNGDIRETDDGLYIRHSPLRGAAVSSYNDHRMAMSLGIAALGAKGDTTISPTDCVSKSYPAFVKDLQMLGANIVEEFC